MSTSDAAAAQPRPRPPPFGSDAAAPTPRRRHVETRGGTVHQESRGPGPIPNGRPCPPAVFGQEEAPAVKAGVLRGREASPCSPPQLLTQPVPPRFTSSIHFRLSRHSSRDVQGDSLRDVCLSSSPGTAAADTRDVCQVDGRAEVAGGQAARPPAPEKTEANGSVCNGDAVPPELCMIPSRSRPRTGATSVDRQADLEEEAALPSSGPRPTMLSPAVVAVLAPHRLRWRRLRRSEDNGSSEDGTTSALEPFGETRDKSLTVGPRGQLRTPFCSLRQRTDVDYETKSRITQTVSLDGSSARTGRGEAAGSEPSSPLPPGPNGRRTSPQPVPPLSLKPTSSSLLLSIRRSNSHVRTGSEAPALSERTLDCNGQAPKTPDSPSISFSPVENGPGRPPPSSNPHRTSTFQAQPLSAPPTVNGSAKMSADSSPRLVPYDHSPLPKAQPVPRRTTLTSTSWWKQAPQDSAAPGTSADAFRNHLASPPPDLAEVRRCEDHPLINYQPVPEACPNLGLKTHAVPESEAVAPRQPDLPFKHRYESSLKIREPLKSPRLPSFSPGLKTSRSAETSNICPGNNCPGNNCPSNNCPSNNCPGNNCPSNNCPGNSRPSNNRPGSALVPADLAEALLSPSSSETVPQRSRNYLFTQATNTHTPPLPAVPQTSPGPSVPVPTNHREAVGSRCASSLPRTPESWSFRADVAPAAGSSQAGPQTLRASRALGSSPLGFERSYASFPAHPKAASALVASLSAYPKTVCSHGSPAPSTPPPGSDSLSGPVSPAPPPAPTTPSSSLLTPPSTPVISSPGFSDPSGPNRGRTENERRGKNPPAEVKKVRRVTWGDSVDLQLSQKVGGEKAARSDLPADSPAPPCRPSVSTKAPSIFSLLRPGHQTANVSPVCPRAPKVSSILVGTAGKCRSLSSDSADLASRLKETLQQPPGDGELSNQGRQNVTSRHERTLSLESGTAQRRSSGALSLPPELSAASKLRYSCPPYTTLMSNRTAQKEAQPVVPRSVLLQPPSQPSYRLLSPHADPVSASPGTAALQKPLALPLQTKANVVDIWAVLLRDQANDNHNRVNPHEDQNGQMCLHGCPAAVITETLVYSIQPAAASAPKVPRKPGGPANPPLPAETLLGPAPVPGQSSRAAEPSDPDGTGWTEPQTPEDESSKRASRDGILGKSRFFSMESSQEQIQKRGRFALKRSTSTPNPNLARSDSDRSGKTSTKMDQMVNRLKKTFSTRRSEDDPSFPWKWRRTSQTPSVIGPAEVGGVSLGSADTPRSVPVQEEQEEQEEQKEQQEPEAKRCSLAPPAACERTTAGGGVGACSGQPPPSSDRKGSPCPERTCVHQPHSPTHLLHVGMDYQPDKHFLSGRDPCPGGGPPSPAACPALPGKATPSPRSPFSPFSSLSPVSSIPSSDVTDDVFYSPKPSRRCPGSPGEPGEGFSLAASRRSRLSTGPPSVSLSPENEYLASSCADLKYGIEPGRSYSVSSVLSSRPSGPGRISTGSRVLSVGSLCESALTYAGKDQDLDVEWDGPHWAVESMRKGVQVYGSRDSSKMRSRSLPRSLTKCLSSWKSGVSPPALGDILTARPALLGNPGVPLFSWAAEAPPTPPPTPPPSPLSPLSRRMSQPPSPSSPGSPQLGDGLSRGHLPSRGHQSSLDTCDESSDSSSETTTDDEYYLETGEEEKETEL